MFENRVLWRISGLVRSEITERWGKLHNGELHNLYSSPNIIRMFTHVKEDGMGRSSSMHGKEKCTQGFDSKIWRKETTRKT
jgi:hypothetical protein